MTTKVKNLNAEQLNSASKMLKAIAHPVRIAILELLANGKFLMVTEIYELLSIKQSTTSHHLGILKSNGVLNSKRKGKNTFYFLKHKYLLNIIECITKCI